MKHYKAIGTFVGFDSILFTEVETLDNKWLINEAIVTFEGKNMRMAFTYDLHNYVITGPLIKSKYEANIICDNKLSGTLTSVMYSNEKGFMLLGSWMEGFMINEVWGRFEWVDKKEVYELQ